MSWSIGDVHVVSQGRVLVVPDWPAPPDVPDWLRYMVDGPTDLAHPMAIVELRRAGLV